jgi:hypothetical protein
MLIGEMDRGVRRRRKPLKIDAHGAMVCFPGGTTVGPGVDEGLRKVWTNRVLRFYLWDIAGRVHPGGLNSTAIEPSPVCSKVQCFVREKIYDPSPTVWFARDYSLSTH